MVKNQHYVPVFYLKQFSNSRNELERLDCQRNELVKPKGPKGICSEPYYYGIHSGSEDGASQLIEKLLKIFEDNISNNINHIKELILTNSFISEEHKFQISLLMSMLYLRGDLIRNESKNIEKNLTEGLIKLILNSMGQDSFFANYERDANFTLPDNYKINIAELIRNDKLNLEFNNIPHFKILTKIPYFANLFNSLNWTVYISKIDHNFITSDNPIAYYDPPNWNKYFGIPFPAKTYYFSLTPKILIKASYNNSNKSFKRKTILKNDQINIINDLNLKIANRAFKFIFSCSQKELINIIKTVKLYKKPSYA